MTFVRMNTFFCFALQKQCVLFWDFNHGNAPAHRPQGILQKRATKRRSQMDNETTWMFERMKLYQLLQTNPEWSLRQLARELGHDVQWVRRWRARIKAAPTITLDVFRSQSRARKTFPQRISEEAKRLVGELRQELSAQFHRRALTVNWRAMASASSRSVFARLPNPRRNWTT
jgi:hypothetical protein